jgi:hypothetical protein
MKRIPDTLLVEGLFCLDTPDKHLLWAVIKRALEDCVLEDTSIRRNPHVSLNTRRGAILWLSDIESAHPMSLRWILEYISSDIESAYRAIHNLINSGNCAEQIKERRSGRRVSKF